MFGAAKPGTVYFDAAWMTVTLFFSILERIALSLNLTEKFWAAAAYSPLKACHLASAN
jgi:hypothetical protein